MGDCERLSGCAFFKEYQKDSSREAVVRGFTRMFCRGGRQDECVRKKISTMLGGPEKLPLNMLPNGMPMTGTGYSNWSDDVMRIVRK
jgi:hypothetical protein